MIHLRTNERFYKEHLESEVKKKTAEVRKLADDLAIKNKELIFVNRLKEEFLQMMSHKLNTPLNVIIGFSQLLIESSKKRKDKKEQESAEFIYSAATRLTNIVDSILTLSSLSAGDLTLTYSRFSLQNFVDSISSEYISLFEKSNSKFTCSIPERPFEMSADYILLSKAVGLLIENAKKYGKQTGRVSLRIIIEDNLVHFIITDNGSGMTASQIAMALEPLGQVDGSMGRKFEGMGLGLPLAIGIAELHGGKLNIISQPGQGTVVSIVVPQYKGDTGQLS
jgi:signal transduction histidine kinase